MSLREGPFQDLKVPLGWAAAIAAAVAVVAALALLLSDRRETMQAQAYGAARKTVDAIGGPVSGVLAAPVRWTGAAVDSVGGYFFAVSENRRLKQQIVDLQAWRDQAIALRNVNARYEALLGLRVQPEVPMVAARVIAEARGPFSNTRLADTGSEHGVEVGNPVLSERGLIGRVVGVTQGASRVLLLTDIASRTPVLIDRTGARAILTGDGGPTPRLEYLRGQDPARPGDRVLTSGDGGVFPRGLPVGVAVKAVDGTWRAKLDSDAAPIDFVRVLLFKDFGQVVDTAKLSASAPPPVTPGGTPVAVPTPPAPSTATRSPSPASGGGVGSGAAATPHPLAGEGDHAKHGGGGKPPAPTPPPPTPAPAPTP